MSLRRRLLQGLSFLALTLSAGTLGFVLLEGWSPLDAAFSSVLVVSTLGFSAQHPETAGAKLLTVGLIVGGVGTLYYLLGVMAQTLIEAQIGVRRERRYRRQMEQVRDHVIVCGVGRVGQEVVREFRRERMPFVVVDAEERRIQKLREEGCLVLRGDASRDEVLRQAGIERARGLVVCTGSDAVNVFITLSARAMRDDLPIVARAIHEDDEPKLRRAGADHAITPTSLGGRRMVGLLLRPTVIELMDVFGRSTDLQMWLEEVRLEARSQVVGRSLGQARLREDVGVSVLAIKRASGELVTNPPAETQLWPGDILVALGTRDALGQLEGLAR